jgi:hypothetical protein
LAHIVKQVVISRTSSFAFKDKNKNIREVGNALNIYYVLEGSVRKFKLRIIAQLIEVQSGSHIWSQTFKRTLDNVFALQDELTFDITQALQLYLLPEQIEHERGVTTNPEAYELFIQDRKLVRLCEPAEMPMNMPKESLPASSQASITPEAKTPWWPPPFAINVNVGLLGSLGSIVVADTNDFRVSNLALYVSIRQMKRGGH